MNHLLILSVLAVLPLMEGQEITSLTACTSATNDLNLNCNYKKKSTGTIYYEWSVLTAKNQTLVLASSMHPNSVAPVYKNRAKVTKTDSQLTVTLTGFGTADDGKYTCHLFPSGDTMPEYNKTISVMKATVQTCGASGLLLNTPWMLSLLLFPVIQSLDV
ncbi:thy-1 membrane glycoprotein-like [Pristis pectinata]|uniref:thy-1 membrane glycoprotein-like n=1 Tax=Pristis pectinata TaxID=685728 RepID=UPI00223CF6B4|nr:thy-1 membrane glycoprotein-like [Pristis pectinata]XP_051896019.1 thy-1 membrane glycoprotein-like [Pristis pectinata]